MVKSHQLYFQYLAFLFQSALCFFSGPPNFFTCWGFLVLAAAIEEQSDSRVKRGGKYYIQDPDSPRATEGSLSRKEVIALEQRFVCRAFLLPAAWPTLVLLTFLPEFLILLFSGLLCPLPSFIMKIQNGFAVLLGR